MGNMTVVKALANTFVCNSTASTFNSGRMIRILNTGTTVGLVTIRDAANTILGTVWVANNNSELFIEKSASDTLESNVASALVGVSVSRGSIS